jgi:pyruvate kinase
MMRRRFSKILATLGPASRDASTLRLLHEAGVDAFRLNFSHGSHEDHANSVKTIRAVEEQVGRPITIVADMQGPKIRVGEVGDGIELRWGEEIELILGEAAKGGAIPVPHPEIFKVSEPGHRLKFDDGKLQVTIVKVTAKIITARVDVPGLLKSRKGLNVIDALLPVSAMTPKDEVDMRFALGQGVDYIALSFVQNADDVRAAKAVTQGRAGIIVKLEKPSALTELDAILAETDAAMVARGDLGVELPLEDVPVAQRRIIRECRKLGKPVIVATHMLESMIDAPTPTRAEASDVASAIYQGADVVMLSAETAVGRHPATAVAVMDRILQAAENDPEYWDGLAARRLSHAETAEDAISDSARSTANILGCKAVFGFTSSGSTVLRLARERPPCRIVGLTPSLDTARRLALVWGVHPMRAEDLKSFEDMTRIVDERAKDCGLASGDSYVVTAGVPFGVTGTTNTLRIGKVD